MLDANTIFLLDRHDFGDRELKSITIDELKKACSQTGVTSRSAKEYREYCDARGSTIDPKQRGRDEAGAGSVAQQPTAQTKELNAEKESLERQLREVLVRLGQAKFRDDLMEVYQGRCAVTGCDAADALEAAHIEPFSDSLSNELSNGILLRADIHKLFDKHLIGIHPETRIVSISPALMSSKYRELDNKPLSVLPANACAYPDAMALGKKWRLFDEISREC